MLCLAEACTSSMFTNTHGVDSNEHAQFMHRPCECVLDPKLQAEMLRRSES